MRRKVCLFDYTLLIKHKFIFKISNRANFNLGCVNDHRFVKDACYYASMIEIFSNLAVRLFCSSNH